MGEKPKYHPEEAAQKKTRSGSRVESKTKIFVSEKGDMGDFIHSEKLREVVDNIFAEASTRLVPEVVDNIKTQFERSVVRGLRTIAQQKEEDRTYDVSVAKGSFYSAKIEMLKHLVESAITNSNSDKKEERLIPELKTRNKMEEAFQSMLLTLEEGEKMVLVSFDLDGFKKINDTLGHEMGDRVLRSFGVSLFKAPRPDDSVAHYSGDEFGVLLKMPVQVSSPGEVVSRIVNAAQEDPDRPIGGKQEVSTGFVEVQYQDKETVDFIAARDRADEAAEISKSLDILLQMRGEESSSVRRIVEYSKIEEEKKRYSPEEWSVAHKVRGLKREFGSKLSLSQMAGLVRMIENGVLQKMLSDQGIE